MKKFFSVFVDQVSDNPALLLIYAAACYLILISIALL